ncbi:nicotinate (nicotinamide) nucleotide adenylyltransferase [uncultured Rikenella sp.]|uniref:nicotinate (nicotinamide) nucleotide adenylyltransferase n=2 Tax=uncultured Rikenella sp. TaxID=368003 RepID=UPI00272BF17F|nr:nicotinate (nicotinamide) nucleotide adenylyltransferase [uncultured Rikenella sp.]
MRRSGERRIALLMGSFNPVHGGHLAVARYVLERELAEEVWMVVSPQNPLKSPEELAPFEDRLEMVRLALEEIGEARLRVCDVERDLPYPFYTIHTIEYLQRLYPDMVFTILAGSDIAAQLPRWHRSEELQRRVRFLFYPRGGGAASPEMAQAPQFEIDSTSIRRALAAGETLAEGVVPAVVEAYTRERGLYGAGVSADFYFERGRSYYRQNDFGRALNDFNRALELEPGHTAAREMRDMTEAIFNFRNFDLYNP